MLELELELFLLLQGQDSVNPATHWESACWRVCSKCGKREHGHRSERCRNDPVSPPDPEQPKAAGRKPKKPNKKRNTGCTYPVTSLAVIKELKAKIMPLTQDLIIVEASGSELKILGTAVIDLQVEVLGEDRKKLEVA